MNPLSRKPLPQTPPAVPPKRTQAQAMGLVTIKNLKGYEAEKTVLNAQREANNKKLEGLSQKMAELDEKEEQARAKLAAVEALKIERQALLDTDPRRISLITQLDSRTEFLGKITKAIQTKFANNPTHETSIAILQEANALISQCVELKAACRSESLTTLIPKIQTFEIDFQALKRKVVPAK